MNRRKGMPKKNNEPKVRINERITVAELRVVGPEGNQLGMLTLEKAMEAAKVAGLDLVEVSPNSKPPVCRIMDYGKYRFEQAKKDKLSKKNQTVIKIKEIKFHPKTAANDYNYRVVQAKDFLLKGNKVKFTVFFRGREMAHQDYGRRLLDQAKIDLEDCAELEMDSRMEGNNMTSIFNPKKVAPVQKKKKQQDEEADTRPTAGEETI